MTSPRDNDEFNCEDIYHKLGNLEGKIDSVVESLKERREDIGTVFSRLRSVENKTSIGVGLAIAFSLVSQLMAPHIFETRLKVEETNNQLGSVTTPFQPGVKELR